MVSGLVEDVLIFGREAGCTFCAFGDLMRVNVVSGRERQERESK